MTEPSLLSAWESFYVIVGSSAAALTGLQFVVITLIADSQRPRGGTEIAAFGTPTVVHFCVVLLIAAVISAPWPSMMGADLSLLACGLGGLAYAAIVIRRARRTTEYTPVFEDWLWHTILPVVAYGSLVVAAITLSGSPIVSLFVIGAVALLLLFIGIHNAWDTVTYLATTGWLDRGAEPASGAAAPSPPIESNEPQGVPATPA